MSVLSDANASPLVQAMVPAFAAGAGLSAGDEERVRDVVAGLVAFTLEHAYPDDDLGEIEVTLEASDGCVHVCVHDWGLPLPSAGGELGPLPQPLAMLARDASNLQLLNLGAVGKRLTADVSARATSDGARAARHVDAAPRLAPAGEGTKEAIEVKRATPEDAEAIAQLLYENYHLSYVHADFYRPRYLMTALEAGELRSALALHEGRVIGHHALMPRPGSASAETGAAVVHSAYRGLGIFGRLFEQTLDAARDCGLASVFGDAVTVHPFSQRAELAHGYRETALQLAMVPGQTTMRGLGTVVPGRRTATLRSYLPFDDGPRQVTMPAPYRELVQSIYANVGLSIEADGGASDVDGEAVSAEVDAARGLGFVRLARWDDGTERDVTRSVRHLLSLHVDVIYADVDLMEIEAVDEAVAVLNELGFFAAGLVLHGPEGHDHLRLQRLDSEDVELENIVCETAFAKALTQLVLEDMARVGD